MRNSPFSQLQLSIKLCKKEVYLYLKFCLQFIGNIFSRKSWFYKKHETKILSNLQVNGLIYTT